MASPTKWLNSVLNTDLYAKFSSKQRDVVISLYRLSLKNKEIAINTKSIAELCDDSSRQTIRNVVKRLIENNMLLILSNHLPNQAPNQHPTTVSLCSKADYSSLKTATNQPTNHLPNQATWITDFDTYRNMASMEFKKLLDNKKWYSTRQTFHPNLNIRETIRKSFLDYWGTKAGWKKKKASAKNSPNYKIDWERTLNNALTLRGNAVYLDKSNNLDINNMKAYEVVN